MVRQQYACSPCMLYGIIWLFQVSLCSSPMYGTGSTWKHSTRFLFKTIHETTLVALISNWLAYSCLHSHIALFVCTLTKNSIIKNFQRSLNNIQCISKFNLAKLSAHPWINQSLKHLSAAGRRYLITNGKRYWGRCVKDGHSPNAAGNYLLQRASQQPSNGFRQWNTPTIYNPFYPFLCYYVSVIVTLARVSRR